MFCVATGDIGKRIQETRATYKGLGMKQTTLAKRIGVSQQRLSAWEHGKHDPEPIGVVNEIAVALEVTPDWLLHGTKLKRTKAEETGMVKIYGAASAGIGNANSIDGAEIEVPIQFAQDDFGALIVDGDSMMPLLHPGDIAIFKDWKYPKPGYVVAAELPSRDWVIKRAVFTDGRFVLRSDNERYPDILEEARCSGFLVGIVRDDGPERLIRLNSYGIKDAL